MYFVENSSNQALPDIATCHIACFPQSLSTRLGKKYVQKSLEWFLINPNRFLFHVSFNGKVMGYCGGFVPVKVGDGSSSGMLQHGFKQAVFGLIKNPLLLFHQEVRPYYPFMWLNIKRKITGKAIPISFVDPSKPFEPKVGLVVIGVHPDSRGSGIVQLLMKEFENRTKVFNQHEMVLSVKKNNTRAVKAYMNNGWEVKGEKKGILSMHKIIS